VTVLAALPVVAILLARRRRDPGSTAPEPVRGAATAPMAAALVERVPTAGPGKT